MNPWNMNNWKDTYQLYKVRSGLRVKCDAGIDKEVHRASIEFCKWLRRNYSFPIRIPIYLKESYYIKAKDGTLVSATFFQPTQKNMEPYARIATGDYYDMLKEDGKDNALGGILHSIAHELTHYYQWINDVHLTDRGEEIQASRYASSIVFEYSQTREHP